MTTRIDLFNEMVGLMFAQLYEAFPVEIKYDDAAIGRAMNIPVEMKEWGGPPIAEFGPLPNGDAFNKVFWSAANWLRDEGFVRASGRDIAIYDVVLTAKGLTALNATPEVFADNKPLGKRLSEAAGSAGTEAGRAAIGEMVGQVIGGITKSVLGA